MDKIRIVGGKPLSGSVQVSGAKNAALPEMAASLLTAGVVELVNGPDVRDVLTARRLLAEMGAEVQVHEDGAAILDASKVTSCEAPYELSRRCEPPSWFLARWWRGSDGLAYRCPAAAPSARGP